MECTALQNSDLPASQGNGQSKDKEDGAQKDEMTWIKVLVSVGGLAWYPEFKSAQASQPLACNDLTLFFQPQSSMVVVIYNFDETHAPRLVCGSESLSSQANTHTSPTDFEVLCL